MWLLSVGTNTHHILLGFSVYSSEMLEWWTFCENTITWHPFIASLLLSNGDDDDDDDDGKAAVMAMNDSELEQW